MGVPSVAEAGQAEVAKKPYRNQTAGWLGVVKLNHLGAQEGVSIEPYGTVYLSDDEAILTARAPAASKDNPFVAKTYQFFNSDTGQVEDHDMAPLVLVDDTEDVAAEHERFVPVASAPATEARTQAEAAHTRQTLARESDREVPTTPVKPVLASSEAAAVPPSQTRPGAPPTATAPEPEDDRPSWTEVEGRTEEPQAGSLGGSNVAAPAAPEGDPLAKGPVGTSSVEASPQTPGAEEHAAHLEGGEETGAADTPVGDPPEGEFAAHEEVGSPEAPSQA